MSSSGPSPSTGRRLSPRERLPPRASTRRLQAARFAELSLNPSGTPSRFSGEPSPHLGDRPPMASYSAGDAPAEIVRQVLTVETAVRSDPHQRPGASLRLATG